MAGDAARPDATAIGRAGGVARDPTVLAQLGTPPDVLMHLKDLWRIIAAHGEPLA
jgi:hypothetical protein